MTRASPGNKLSDVLAAAEEGLAAIRCGRRLASRRLPVSETAEFTAQRIVRIRKRLSVSQAAFARLLAASLPTVRAWEMGSKTPSGAARRQLQIAEYEPEAFRRFLRTAI